VSVQGLITVAHLAGLREGVATATGDQHGRSQNEKPDPSISGDHVGQISLSNPDQTTSQTTVQSALALLPLELSCAEGTKKFDAVCGTVSLK
jgi:hypothetical protein